MKLSSPLIFLIPPKAPTQLKIRRIACVTALIVFSAYAGASEALSAGYIKNPSYRGGYVNFRVVAEDGTNYCAACPVDPGGMSNKQCWVPETEKAEIALLLLASAQNKKISGRVEQFSTNCTVYQLSIQD